MSHELRVADVDPRIAAAVGGDRAAAAALLEELLPRVRNLIRYLVRGDTDVDDIAQESLIALLRGLPGFRGEAPLAAWADRVVARTTFAYLARVRASERRAAAAEPEELPGVANAEQYALRRQLARLLDRLPAEQRDAVVLHHAAGMSAPEIAELVGAPFETVRSRLRLGMASLRALMADAGRER